jgi:hypothetical protein
MPAAATVLAGKSKSPVCRGFCSDGRYLIKNSAAVLQWSLILTAGDRNCFPHPLFSSIDGRGSKFVSHIRYLTLSAAEMANLFPISAI